MVEIAIVTKEFDLARQWAPESSVRSKEKKGALIGRKALITGASKGIGRQIALALANSGAEVAINYRASEDSAFEVARIVEESGMCAWTYKADVSNFSEIEEMKEFLTKYFGPIDILVNNAGINRDTLFKKMDKNAWDTVLDVNLNGVFNCSHKFLDQVVESENGRIINISSIVGQMGNIGQVNYAASKAGIIGMTKALARELARFNVTVNAVAPGFIETEMVAGIPDQVKEKILVNIPLGRFGKPEEVAKAVLYLASPDASYITGTVLSINGGMYI